MMCTFHLYLEKEKYNLTALEITLIAVWTCLPPVNFFAHLAVGLCTICSQVLGEVHGLFHMLTPIIRAHHTETSDVQKVKVLVAQSCPALCNPMGCSPPGFSVHGISRQEHWSGLPFPSPMHESEKRRWSRSVMSDSYRPHGLQPTRLLRPWDLPGKSTGVRSHRLLCRSKNMEAQMNKVWFLFSRNSQLSWVFEDPFPPISRIWR